MTINTPALEYSAQPKLGMSVLSPLNTRDDLSLAYTPGIAAVATAAAAHPDLLFTHSFKRRNLAVISDGTAVLGLGNIGPYGAYPVMEGKALLFKKFGGIDAVPLVLDAKDPDSMIQTIKHLAPSFAAINLEDIAAPNCFVIEDALIQALPNYPLMHDDQHGTAVVVLAALENALTLFPKNGFDSRIVISGAGAAGWGITLLLHHAGYRQLSVVDSRGVVTNQRMDLDPVKRRFLDKTHPWLASGSLAEALVGAQIFIGVSKGNLVTPAQIQTMAPEPIIIAMANPQPEILPDLAYTAGAGLVATGRSDFYNQVNNALAFPGIFAAAIEKHQTINLAQRVAAAKAIVQYHERNLAKDNLMPSILDPSIHDAIKNAVIHSY